MAGIKSKIINLAKITNANKSKVQTEVLAELLFYRMATARLGEEDNNAGRYKPIRKKDRYNNL